MKIKIIQDYGFAFAGLHVYFYETRNGKKYVALEAVHAGADRRN